MCAPHTFPMVSHTRDVVRRMPPIHPQDVRTREVSMRVERAYAALTETPQTQAPLKPLLRGWFHALAAVAAVGVTAALCWQSRADLPRLLSLAVFGLSM